MSRFVKIKDYIINTDEVWGIFKVFIFEFWRYDFQLFELRLFFGKLYMFDDIFVWKI